MVTTKRAGLPILVVMHGTFAAALVHSGGWVVVAPSRHSRQRSEASSLSRRGSPREEFFRLFAAPPPPPGQQPSESSSSSSSCDVAEALAREATKRSLTARGKWPSPSPLLPPDAVVKTVLEALQQPDVPEQGTGFRVAFDFTERDPDDDARRSSWAWGALRGRCNWAARGLPLLDRMEAEEAYCDVSDDDDDSEEDQNECRALCDAGDALFLDADAHAAELRFFHAALVHHTAATFIRPPRWGAHDLVEFDLHITTDTVDDPDGVSRRTTRAVGDIVRRDARCLLHRGGPLNDTWLVRGFDWIREKPTPPRPPSRGGGRRQNRR